MARPEVTGRKAARTAKKKRKSVLLVPNAAAFTIREFCEAHRLSEAMYYKLRALGLGPRERRALTKIIITQEAAADWRQGEASASTAP